MKRRPSPARAAAASAVKSFPDGELLIRNRQRTRPVDLRLLRRIARDALSLQPALRTFELGIHLIGAEEMAAVNETFLQHAGSTDVITFDYSAEPTPNPSKEGNSSAGSAHVSRNDARPHSHHSPPGRGRGWVSSRTDHLHGEIFICLDDAVAHARRFRTLWQAELARYVIHGVLHLRGHDDLTPAARRKMKREEARQLREIARRHALSRLGRRARIAR